MIIFIWTMWFLWTKMQVIKQKVQWDPNNTKQKKALTPLMPSCISVYTWAPAWISEGSQSLNLTLMPWVSSFLSSFVLPIFNFQINLPKILWSSCNCTAWKLSMIPHCLHKKPEKILQHGIQEPSQSWHSS